MTTAMKTAKEWQVEAEAVAAAARRILNSEDGKVLLKSLTRQYYDGELMHADPARTAFALGRRDVVRYLRDLANEGKDV